ncbi:hypothetical protein CCMSSC00406_0010141 [Pleurotus cornucopiae]|uniref:Uncharacterized protein n=1 Tax=Pleurotus cornucopiae TaxID=5321 RepID=A0ACB7ITK2_PLECO|nr:hypothetical protein CCMSSC00406_0010141 [Pleurotus cornucopiae]
MAPRGRKRIHLTEEDKRSASRAKKRRHYEKHRDDLLEKARLRYNNKKQAKAALEASRPMAAGRRSLIDSQPSELIPYAESYERIFDRIYAIRGCSDTSHASTVCDLVLLTRDPAVAVKANKSLEDIQSSLTLLMHEVLQFGYSELWQDMEMTMGLLRRIIGMSLLLGGCRDCVQIQLGAQDTSHFHFSVPESATASLDMPLANEFVPATLTPEEKRFLKEHTQSFREALKSHEESVWFERFWMVYFDRFPIAGHIIDLDERDFHRRRWKRAISHHLQWRAWNFRKLAVEY